MSRFPFNLEYSSDIECPVSALREFHFHPGAFETLTPPWEKVIVVEAPTELANGAKAVIDTKVGPLTLRWVAEHHLTDDGFVDHQLAGPFSSWTHHHRFIAIDENQCRLIDAIDYELPLGALGRLFGSGYIRKKLDRMFKFRHEITKSTLES